MSARRQAAIALSRIVFLCDRWLRHAIPISCIRIICLHGFFFIWMGSHMRDDCYVGCTHHLLQDNLESMVCSMFTVPNVFGVWQHTFLSFALYLVCFLSCLRLLTVPIHICYLICTAPVHWFCSPCTYASVPPTTATPPTIWYISVQIIHKGAHLCPVSETEEKRLWARKFQLYKQSKQGKTVWHKSHKSPDQPGKETAEVITANGPHNTVRVHKHSISTQF